MGDHDDDDLLESLPELDGDEEQSTLAPDWGVAIDDGPEQLDLDDSTAASDPIDAALVCDLGEEVGLDAEGDRPLEGFDANVDLGDDAEYGWSDTGEREAEWNDPVDVEEAPLEGTEDGGALGVDDPLWLDVGDDDAVDLPALDSGD